MCAHASVRAYLRACVPVVVGGGGEQRTEAKGGASVKRRCGEKSRGEGGGRGQKGKRGGGTWRFQCTTGRRHHVVLEVLKVSLRWTSDRDDWGGCQDGQLQDNTASRVMI